MMTGDKTLFLRGKNLRIFKLDVFGPVFTWGCLKCML